jgi:predicted transposase/invertase (TIGR01784 family)
MMDDETHEVFSEKLIFVYVELPKFNLALEELTTFRDKWIYFLKYATEFRDVPEVFSDEPFELAFHLAEVAQLTEDEIYYYEGSLKQARDRYASLETARLEGVEEGRAKGIAEGRTEGIGEGIAVGEKRRAIQIAQALIKQQMPLETILQLTGLTVEELQPLLSDVQNESLT